MGLETKVTDELKKEGYVRDLIRGIQNLRKESGLNVTDRIILTYSGDDDLKAAFVKFSDLVCNETLATKVDYTSEKLSVEIESDDKKWGIKIEKE